MAILEQVRVDPLATAVDPSDGVAADPFAEWVESARDRAELVHLHRIEARAGVTAELERPLAPGIWEALGVGALWSHQAEALDLLRNRRSAVVATGTGSGKSLIYQAAMAEAVTAPIRPRTALALFPTKALAQDQARALRSLDLRRLAVGTYDGDCTADERTWARTKANVVLTNPEMLHYGLLPNHRKWSTFLGRLAYVVVDELHLLRGVFGSHVAHVLRRLRRLCAHYGAVPTFAFTSATIGEPAKLARDLCGLDVTAVTEDGSPRSEKLFALWNPPVLDQRDGAATPKRASAGVEAAVLSAGLIADGRRTIVFARSRRATEVIAADIQRRLPRARRDSVRPYRSGYLAEERREIELALFEGELSGIVTTSALELGIDVAGLDTAVMAGFPGTVSSMWQQAGRAGRDRRPSLAVLVAGDDQLDQWLMSHPRDLFDRPPEPAVVNPANPYVLGPHLECAAYELPLTPLDSRFWPEWLDDGVRDLVMADRLRVRRWGRRNEPVAAWNGEGMPAHRIGLRSSGGRLVSIRERSDDRLVGTVDRERAAAVVHPGAVYLHRGSHFRVLELDLEAGVAWVEPTDGSTYTVARTDVSFRVRSTDRSRSVGAAGLALGTVEVTTAVSGYHELDSTSRVARAVRRLDIEPSQLVTRAVWYTFDSELLMAAGVDGERVAGALHALEHAAIGMLPLFTICDRWDVGGVSTARQQDTGRPTVAIYDGYPGGAGIAELAYDFADRHLDVTASAIADCTCHTGCPSCVQSPKCGNGNEPLDKAAALALARAVLAG